MELTNQLPTLNNPVFLAPLNSPLFVEKESTYLEDETMAHGIWLCAMDLYEYKEVPRLDSKGNKMYHDDGTPHLRSVRTGKKKELAFPADYYLFVNAPGYACGAIEVKPSPITVPTLSLKL